MTKINLIREYDAGYVEKFSALTPRVRGARVGSADARRLIDEGRWGSIAAFRALGAAGRSAAILAAVAATADETADVAEVAEVAS
jgi:hypothetical protein